MGRKPKTNFLLFLVPSATSLLIAVGKLNVAIVINKLNVGNIKEYIPIPFRKIVSYLYA